jgi:hypothetical protein
VITRGITKGEFNYITDESVQAVTGLYFADFLHDLPVTHPIEYTLRYEAQYPALGLLHWPPVFHFVEGVMFLLLGRTVVVARVAVLMFALFGSYFWFKLVTHLQDSWTAAASTIVLVSHRELLLYEKTVMLEIPALAICIAASFCWIQYLERGLRRHVWWFALLASAAILTKYQSAYLGVFCLLMVIVERKWRRVLNFNVVAAAGFSLLLIVPYGIVAYRLVGHWLLYLATQAAGATYAALKLPPGPNPYAYYWMKLPGQLGWPLLGLSVIGLLTCKWWAKKEGAVTMLMWIAACYLTMSLVSTKEPRYILYWLPPWVYFALGPLTAKLRDLRVGLLRTFSACALLLAYAGWAWTYQRPYVSGYEAAARYVIQRDGRGLVLFDGDLPGNFIFFMRSLDPARRFVIVKRLSAVTEGGTWVATTRAGLQKFIDEYGVKSVLISENFEMNFDEHARLRELLQTPDFRLVERFPVETNVPNLRDHNLLLYQKVYLNPTLRPKLTLWNWQTNREIEISLDGSLR